MGAPTDPPAPLRVILVCAAGMSSSLVETHLRQAAENAGLTLAVRSVSAFEMEHLETDAAAVRAILVAPQVRFLRRNLERRFGGLGITVLPIEPMDFGMADGPAILAKLLAAIGRAPAGLG